MSDIDRQTDIGRETEKEKQRQRVIDKETYQYLLHRTFFDTFEKLVKNSHAYIHVDLPQ